MEGAEDEEDMMPRHVDDHSHDDLTLLEYARALPASALKLSCRGKEKGSNLHYYFFISPLHY